MKVDGPLASWFPYTRDASREDRRALAIARMTAKATFTAELRELISGPDAELAAEALRLFNHLPHPSPESIPTITNSRRTSPGASAR